MNRAMKTAAALLFGLAGPLAAQDLEIGKEAFDQYCATCHGQDATGNGPMAEMMTASVPDLTQLAARNDGTFPMLRVIHVIDGRT